HAFLMNIEFVRLARQEIEGKKLNAERLVAVLHDLDDDCEYLSLPSSAKQLRWIWNEFDFNDFNNLAEDSREDRLRDLQTMLWDFERRILEDFEERVLYAVPPDECTE